MRTSVFAFILDLIILSVYNYVNVDGHLFKKPPAKQTDPDGKCDIESNKPPGTQVGNMVLHPCRHNHKLTIRCPSFLREKNSSLCTLENHKGIGKPPFNLTVTDLYDELLLTLHRHEGVNFMQFFIEAREWRSADLEHDDSYMSRERFGRFFDRIDDGHSVYKNGDRQCHEDVCCEFKDVPDVATRCQRPWMGPYDFVGGLYVGNIDQFSWKIPEGYHGTIIFVGTFITSVKEYWPDIHSSKVIIEKSAKIYPRQRYDEDFADDLLK